MPSKFFRKTLAARAPETKVFVQKYLDFVLRLEAVRSQKNVTQQQLADVLKISLQDWLSGNYSLTLNSIIKLETFLEAELITIPATGVPVEEQTKVLKIVHRSCPYQVPPTEAEWLVAVSTTPTVFNFAIAL
jgi:transcriptional regulator with XRE-family HTH domain